MTLPRKLNARPALPGFSAVDFTRSRRVHPNPDWSNHGIVCEHRRGFFMDEDGDLYAIDAYDRIFAVYPPEYVGAVVNEP